MPSILVCNFSFPTTAERDSVKGFHNLSHMVAHPPRSAERLATHNVDPVGMVTAVSTMSDLGLH